MQVSESGQFIESLRERKKAQTREALCDAAFELFEEKGFDGTTVDEIAALADVSRRTFFRYFATKEAVVFPEHEGRAMHFTALLALREPGETPWEAVRRATLMMAEIFTEDSEALLAQHRVVEASASLTAYERELDRSWEKRIAETLALNAGRSARAKWRAGLRAAATMGVIRATLESWFVGGTRGNLLAMGVEALDLLESGMEAATR